MAEDILTRITAQRVLDVAAARVTVPASSLEARISSCYPAPPLDLCAVLRAAAGLAVAAEFKRASPSKGSLAPADAAVGWYAAEYTLGGAAVLSVLTEPHWFKGSLADLEGARAAAASAAASAGLPGRPAMLRKDFIVDAYQLLEARAFGADTALLIVASLPTPALLAPLLAASRALGMEPLVEVNSVAEFEVASAVGARVVGINNRNLRTFEVDLGTTARVVAAAAAAEAAGAPPVALLSLSGLRSAEDAAALVADCAAAAGGAPGACPPQLRGFLIGEALMRSEAPRAMVAALLAAGGGGRGGGGGGGGGGTCGSGAPSEGGRLWPAPLLAKVCGVKDVGSALAAARAGAHLVGCILVPGSPRFAGVAGAAALSRALRAFREQDPAPLLRAAAALPARGGGGGGGALDAARLREGARLLGAAAARARPLLVGVFQDAPAGEVARAAAEAGLDAVQLHGDERPADFAGFPLPLVKVLRVRGGGEGGGPGRELAAAAAAWSHVAAALLLDGAAGGSGVGFDHGAALRALDGAEGADARGALPLLLAGGLKPAALGATFAALRAAGGGSGGAAAPWAAVWGADVSSGVEAEGGEKGVKDPAKVADFVGGVARAWGPLG